MSTLDAIWANTQADGNFDEKNEPPAGYMGVVRVADYRTGKSKRGELYFAVDIKDDAQGYLWGIYKAFTKGGQPHEGSIKSAKITLRQLGVEVASPAQLDAALKGVLGRYYTAEVVASDRINNTTGMPYTNTNITGVASPPAQAAPVAVQAPQAPQPTQVATPQGVASFPPAVAPAPVQTLEQVLAANPVGAPVAQAGDDHPFN